MAASIQKFWQKIRDWVYHFRVGLYCDARKQEILELRIISKSKTSNGIRSWILHERYQRLIMIDANNYHKVRRLVKVDDSRKIEDYCSRLRHDIGVYDEIMNEYSMDFHSKQLFQNMKNDLNQWLTDLEARLGKDYNQYTLENFLTDNFNIELLDAYVKQYVGKNKSHIARLINHLIDLNLFDFSNFMSNYSRGDRMKAIGKITYDHYKIAYVNNEKAGQELLSNINLTPQEINQFKKFLYSHNLEF